MPLQAVRRAVLVYAVQLFQGPLKSCLGLRLAACATTPVTIGLVELRGSIGVLAIDDRIIIIPEKYF